MKPLLSVSALVLLLVGCPCLIAPPFHLNVVPGKMNDTIPEQRCVLLVGAADGEAEGEFEGTVHITASAPGATVIVEHQDITPGQLAEVTVIPQHSDVPMCSCQDGRKIWVTINGEAEGCAKWVLAPITVTSEEEDLVGPEAAPVRDLFIPWLAENHPELGITAETDWTGTIVTPHILVVTHYLYFSDEWEMHVFWHVMMPPYDWARIELRRRFAETAPSLAFEIPSRSAEPIEVAPIEPSDTLWR